MTSPGKMDDGEPCACGHDETDHGLTPDLGCIHCGNCGGYIPRSTYVPVEHDEAEVDEPRGIAGFLLARVAEDKADAMVGWRWKALPAGEYARLQARVLVECDAKRRIVEQSHVLNRHGPGSTIAPELLWVLKTLALPYANHPDYRESWRP